VAESRYRDSVDYTWLRRRLFSRFVEEQTAAMRSITARVGTAENLAGSYHYILNLCETVAGAPYFGPLVLGSPLPVDRITRQAAIEVLGDIGDLQSASVLSRILQYEPDTTLQTAIIRSLASLGTAMDGRIAVRLAGIVDRDARSGASDPLAEAVIDLVEALDRFEGGYATQSTIDALLAIADANYGRATRLRALSTLRLLGRSGE
jgi:hypothetical protein